MKTNKVSIYTTVIQSTNSQEKGTGEYIASIDVEVFTKKFDSEEDAQKYADNLVEKIKSLFK